MPATTMITDSTKNASRPRFIAVYEDEKEKSSGFSNEEKTAQKKTAVEKQRNGKTYAG